MFDREDVVRSIQPGEMIGGRIAVAGGSFFEDVPIGADLYMLIRVLHDWRDEDCRRILRACRAAMGPEALLLLGEQILEPDPARGRPIGYLTDMQMMAMFGSARERTEDEFRGLLADSGLVLRRVIPTETRQSSPVARAARHRAGRGPRVKARQAGVPPPAERPAAPRVQPRASPRAVQTGSSVPSSSSGSSSTSSASNSNGTAS